MKLVKRMFMIVFLILGIISTLYGVSVMMLRSGTKFFLIWYGFAAICFLLAALCRGKLWGTLPGILRVILAGAFLLAILCFTFVEYRIVDCARAEQEQDLSYLIVLGAQVKEDGPSSVLQRRLDAAITYMEKNPDTVCIVSGGQGPIEPWAESKGMAEYLLANGVAEAKIIEENQALNTVQNIQYSMKLMDDPQATVGIVTNDFHMLRGLSIARYQGIEHAYPIVATSSLFYKPNNLLREFFGIGKDILKKNMSISSLLHKAVNVSANPDASSVGGGEQNQQTGDSQIAGIGRGKEEAEAGSEKAEGGKQEAEIETESEKAEIEVTSEEDRVQNENLSGEEDEDEEFDRDYTDYVQGEVTAKELKKLGYPSSLVRLYKKNKEAREFVLNYAVYDDMNKDASDIDISEEVKKGKYPHFLQWDERWGYEYYGDDYLSVTGCGPTALSVVYCGLTGDSKKNPLTVAKMAEKRDLVVGKQGSKWSIMTELGRDLGLTVYESYPDAETIKAELKKKHPIIAIMGKGRFTDGGHFIVLCGIDKKGKIIIRDSNSIEKTEKKWKVETLLEEMQDMWVYSK